MENGNGEWRMGMENGKWEMQKSNEKLKMGNYYLFTFSRHTFYNIEHIFFSDHYRYPCSLSKKFGVKFRKCDELMIGKEVSLTCFVKTLSEAY